MNSLHSLQQNLLMAATISGWRLDAMLLGGLLWILVGLFGEWRPASGRLRALPALTRPIFRMIDVDPHHRRERHLDHSLGVGGYNPAATLITG